MLFIIGKCETQYIFSFLQNCDSAVNKISDKPIDGLKFDICRIKYMILLCNYLMKH